MQRWKDEQIMNQTDTVEHRDAHTCLVVNLGFLAQQNKIHQHEYVNTSNLLCSQRTSMYRSDTISNCMSSKATPPANSAFTFTISRCIEVLTNAFAKLVLGEQPTETEEARRACTITNNTQQFPPLCKRPTFCNIMCMPKVEASIISKPRVSLQ